MTPNNQTNPSSTQPNTPAVTITTPPNPPQSNVAPQAPSQPKPTNSAGTLILQWLTYGLWGWTVLALCTLTVSVLMFYLNGTDTGAFTPYGIAAVLVLLPISITCDIFYAKVEPARKSGAALVIMVIHAVLFALFAVGSLITAVFAMVNLATSASSEAAKTTITLLWSSLIIMVFYVAVFMRTLNPANLSFIRKAFLIFMGIAIGFICILSIAGPTLGARKTRDDKLIEENLSSIETAMTSYMRDQTSLPDSLNSLNLSGDAKLIVDRNLVTYKPNTQAKSSSGSLYSSYTKHYYQLCTTYKAESPHYSTSSSSSSSSEDSAGYSSYISAYNHPSGDVCYKVSVEGKAVIIPSTINPGSSSNKFQYNY